MDFKNIFLKTLFLSLLFTSNSLSAQDQPKFNKQEIGLQLVGLDNFDFDFLYKKQVKQNAYRRIGLAFASLNMHNVGDNGNGNFSVGINIGRENRKSINDKLNFVHGVSWLLNSSLNTSENNTFSAFSTGVGYLLGVHYQLNESFYIGAEIIPSLTTSFVINDGFDNLSFNAGFNSRSVGLSIVYKFEKT